MGFRYVSIFSGVEAASLAWEPLGWEPMAFSEIEPFPCAVLAERWPDVPNLGDITKIDWKEEIDGAIDLVVGGSPCQSFSVAGKREGLKGASGLIFGVAQRRRRLFLVGHLGAESPAEVLFESDCLSGNPQSSREKRKELASRAGRSAACAGFKYSAAPRANTIGYAEEQANTLTADRGQNIVCMTGTQAHCHISNEIAGCLTAHMGKDDAPVVVGGAISVNAANEAFGFAQNTRNEVRIVGDGTLSGALAARPGMKQTTFVCTGSTCPINEQIATRDKKLGCGTGRRVGAYGDPAFTLLENHPHMVASEIGDKPAGVNPMLVRRLTPLECERLQGFPDGHTQIAWKGKPAEDCPDGPRYKAIGNSMAVPVMRWIGRRIAAVDAN